MSESIGGIVVDDEISLVPAHCVEAEAIFRLVRKNLDQLGDWMGWAGPAYAHTDAENFLESCRSDWDGGVALNYVVQFMDVPAGTVGLMHLKSPAKVFEIGYWLNRAAQGRGVMTRACRALLREAFTGLGANLVEIRAASDNRASRAVAERLGMVEEATLRLRSDNARGDLLDLVVYSISRAEWEHRVC